MSFNISASRIESILIFTYAIMFVLLAFGKLDVNQKTICNSLSIFLLIRSSHPLSLRSVLSFIAIRPCRAAIPAPQMSNRRPKATLAAAVNYRQK